MAQAANFFGRGLRRHVLDGSRLAVPRAGTILDSPAEVLVGCRDAPVLTVRIRRTGKTDTEVDVGERHSRQTPQTARVALTMG